VCVCECMCVCVSTHLWIMGIEYGKKAWRRATDKWWWSVMYNTPFGPIIVGTALLCATWLIRECDMTHSFVMYNTLVVWYTHSIYYCLTLCDDVTRSWVGRDSSMGGDMTHVSVICNNPFGLNIVKTEYIYTYMYTVWSYYGQNWIHIYICICINMWICVYVYIYIYIYIYKHVHVYIYMYVYIHVYIYIYTYIYTFIYIYIHTHIYLCIYTYSQMKIGWQKIFRDSKFLSKP